MFGKGLTGLLQGTVKSFAQGQRITNSPDDTILELSNLEIVLDKDKDQIWVEKSNMPHREI